MSGWSSLYMEEPRGLCVLVGRGMRGYCYGRFYHVAHKKQRPPQRPRKLLLRLGRRAGSILPCGMLAPWSDSRWTPPVNLCAKSHRPDARTQHAPGNGANQAGSFHIRDIVLDMSLTGLNVSLLAFLVTIMQRKWGLYRHFAFHGMFHEASVQRKHTWIEKCSHGIHWLHLMA